MASSFASAANVDTGGTSVETKPQVRPVRPETEKIVQVVAGLADWTEAESAWIVEHPELIDYQRRLALALEKAERESCTRDGDSLVIACVL
jgi:hypothetical protein